MKEGALLLALALGGCWSSRGMSRLECARFNRDNNPKNATSSCICSCYKGQTSCTPCAQMQPPPASEPVAPAPSGGPALSQ